MALRVVVRLVCLFRCGGTRGFLTHNTCTGSGFEFEVKQPVKGRHAADESNYSGSVIGFRDNKCNIENHK